MIIAKKDTLSKGNKIALIIISAVLLASIAVYQSNVNNQSEYSRAIYNAFEQGKTLKCGEYNVNKSRFLYVSGTQNFMPKENQEELRGVMINISECSIQQ